MRLIDADDLLAEYDRQHEGEPGKARKLIEDAPTIDRPTRSQFKRMAVQLGYEPVRHGRWIEKEKYTFGIMYDCSLCENRILDNGHHWNYCPNCGAKMDGAE